MPCTPRPEPTSSANPNPTLALTLWQDLEAARLRSVSAADVAALKSRSELLNGQKASLLSEMQAMVRF